MDFAGKVVVLTGAGGGLGRCLALQLGEQGATIACVDTNSESLQETGSLLEASSIPCSLHRADVSDPAAVTRLVAEIDSRHGGFDVLINNAGIMQSFTTISSIALEEIERITQVNYWGTVLLVKASLPILEARGEALIVNISSLSALMAFRGQTAYSASKAAVRIFTEGLQLELIDKGVDVALIMPGTLRTEIAENSPFHSQEAKERLRRMSEGGSFALAPDRAASKILKALRKRHYRVVLGSDAWLLDKCYRLAPVTTSRLLGWVMKRMPITAAS